MINFEERLTKCKYIKDGYCSKIRHPIENGYAFNCHCKDCRYFEIRKPNVKDRNNEKTHFKKGN